jgi:hypothetical protein
MVLLPRGNLAETTRFGQVHFMKVPRLSTLTSPNVSSFGAAARFGSTLAWASARVMTPDKRGAQ